MHTLTVAYAMGSFQTFLFGEDKEAAEAAFEKLQSAMDEYRRFTNKAAESVVIVDSKSKTVFRIEHLASVSLGDMSAAEPDQKAWQEYDGRLLAARKRAEAKAALTA